MRVALIYDTVYPFVIGGVERRNYALAHELRDSHEVTFYSFDYWADDGDRRLPRCRYASLGRAVPRYDSDGRRRAVEALVLAARLLPALFRSREEVWDVANIPFFSVLAAWFASRFRGRVLIVTWHEFWGREYWNRYLGWRGRLGRWIELAALRCSPRVIAVSELTRRRLISAGYPSDRITLLPNGIDLDDIASVRDSGERYDLICVARLLPHKRVGLAIEALKHLRRARPSATLAIIGDGPQRAELERQAASRGLSTAVRFLGELPNARDVYALMKSCSVLVAPSEREGFGIVVIEAWACGLPAVVCAGAESAMPELIDQPFKGRVVEASGQSIAAACNELLEQNADDRRPLLLEAAAGYDWRRIAQHLAAVYCDALASSRTSDSAATS